MAVDFKTSKTKENLMKAFAGESQARNRYTIAADAAADKKMYGINRIFLFTAEQERAHAKRYYELLKEMEGTTIDICAGFPADTYEDLTDLLKAAEHNETQESEDVYPSFGDTAREEGFLEAASAFYQIAEIERTHAARFRKLRELLESNTYFEAEREEAWMCLNCGNIHRGKTAPRLCPICRYDRGYFIPLSLAPYTDLQFVKL